MGLEARGRFEDGRWQMADFMADVGWLIADLREEFKMSDVRCQIFWRVFDLGLRG